MKTISKMLLLTAIYLFATSCQDTETSQEDKLQGTKWKAISVTEAQTEGLRELEPKGCNECYTLTFDTDNTLSMFSSANGLTGSYTVNYTDNSIHLSGLFGTEVGERGDGTLYVNALQQVHSFSYKDNELKLYYNNGMSYLFFTKQ